MYTISKLNSILKKKLDYKYSELQTFDEMNLAKLKYAL